MSIQASWLRRGYFDLSGEDPRHTTTQLIRDQLEEQLGMQPGGLRIANYPVGAAWRHTYWWREGKVDYAEAQFFAQICEDRPSLSLGLSVEKGLENLSGAPIRARATCLMDRAEWDWPRLVKRARRIVNQALPTTVTSVPPFDTVTLRIDTIPFEKGADTGKKVRAFSFTEGAWYERYRGSATVDAIVEQITEADRLSKHWVNVYFAFDLGPAEAAGMSAADVAAALMRLQPVRSMLRP